MERAPPARGEPPPLPLLEGASGALARASAPGPRVFSASGSGALASGSELRGIDEVRTADWSLLAGLDAGCGPSSAVVVGPHSLRRETLAGGGSVLETFLLPVDLAGAALQWRRPAGDGRPLALHLRWRTAPLRGESPAWSIEGGSVRLRPRPEDGPEAWVHLDPAPSRWTIEEDGAGLRLAAPVEAPPGRAVTLLLAAGEGGSGAAAALERLQRLGAEEARAEQAARDALEEGLATRTGVSELDLGLAWARLRIRGAIARHGGRATLRWGGGACPEPPGEAPAPEGEGLLSPAAREAWLALGAVAAGEAAPAEILMAGDYPTALHLLVAARHVAWRGEPGVLLPHRDRLAAAARRELAGPAGDLWPAAVAAILELADAWESLGERGDANRLRDGAARLQAGAAPAAAGRHGRSGGVRRLPVLLREAGPAPPSSAPPGAALLAAALGLRADLPGDERGREHPATLVHALRGWALLAAGDPERGYLLFREHLSLGFQGGSGAWPSLRGRGPTGSGIRPCRDDPAAAAMIPSVFLFGLLGARAEAAVGRVRLAPRLPAAWESFRVGRIRVGDAELEMEYRREGVLHSYRLRQTRGRMPLMLVFEPEVPAAAPGEARIDGALAGLGHFARMGRWGVRVQLPLDRERTVSLAADPRP